MGSYGILRRMAALLLAGTPLALGQAVSPEETPAALVRLQREAEVLEAETARLGGEGRALLAGLAAATARRDLAMAQAEVAERRRGALDQEVEALAVAAVAATGREARARQALASRLRALSRRGPSAGLLAVAAAPDPAAAVTAYRALADRLRLDQMVVARARRVRQEAAAARAVLAARRQDLELAVAAAQAARAQAEEAVRRQQERLQAIRVQESLFRQAAGEYRRAAAELDAFLTGRRSQAPAGVDPRSLRGTLRWPARGPVLTLFGPRRHPRFGTLLPHNGIDIGAEAGTPVQAVAGGAVVYADWFAGYGRTVIVDHGGGVMTVSAHLSRLLVGVGERVAPGQELGRVGDSGTLEGPRLYFEIRVEGRPEPPMAWLAPA